MTSITTSSFGRPDRPLVRRSLSEMAGMLGLAFPIVIGLTASTLIGVVDTIMIAPLGTDVMGAASLTTSAMIIMYTVVYGLIAVVNVRLAQGEGANDPQAVASALHNGAAVAVFAGLIGTGLMLAGLPLLSRFDQPESVLTILAPYWIVKSFVLIPYALLSAFRGLFNAVRRPWMSAAIAFAAVAVNIPLNYVFINGAFGVEGLGLFGAGVGSLLAQFVALAIAFAYWRMAKRFARYRVDAPLSIRQMLTAFRDGLPVAVGNLAEGGAYAVAGVILGLFGAAALAANQVVHAIAAVMYMLPAGMTSAVSIRIGQAIGAQEAHRLRAIGLSATGLVLIWMTAFLIVIAVFRNDIARGLSDDQQVIPLATTMFLTVAFTQFADGLQSTSIGALRGLVDVRIPTAVTLIAFWGVGLPAAYVLGFQAGFGPNGVWIGYGLGVLLSAIVLQTRFWMKSATAGVMGL